MTLRRRDLLLVPALLGAGPAAARGVLDAFTGGATPREDGVRLLVPGVAEDGYSVPIDLSAPGADSIALFAPENPEPLVATFTFGPLAVPAVSTRIRMARSQELVAVARIGEGFAEARRYVEVINGGCGA